MSLIIITRPKLAYCRQGLAGVSLCASGAQLAKHSPKLLFSSNCNCGSHKDSLVPCIGGLIAKSWGDSLAGRLGRRRRRS